MGRLSESPDETFAQPGLRLRHDRQRTLTRCAPRIVEELSSESESVSACVNDNPRVPPDQNSRNGAIRGPRETHVNQSTDAFIDTGPSGTSY